MTDWNVLRNEDDEIEIDNEEEDLTFMDHNKEIGSFPNEKIVGLAAKPNSYACRGEYLTQFQEFYEEDEEEFEMEDDEIEIPDEMNIDYSSFKYDHNKSPNHQICFKEKDVKIKSHNKRRDRCIYKHRTGAGLRKQNNKNRDINESMSLYLDEGYNSYSDRIHELRTANFNDLRPQNENEIDDFSSNRDFKSGCGSKIINIIRLRPGSFTHSPKKMFGKIKFTKKDIISEDVDLDIHDYWDHVSHELMEDGAFVEAKYLQFKERALEDRAKLGAGNSAEMNMLYCFWCFYLREHFNREMYEEFLTTAREDNSLDFHYGMECFFRFCSYGLEMFWDKNVYDTFEDEAMIEYKKGNKYGLEKFKAFHINQKYDFPIPIKPETQKELDKYPTCRSFREPINTKQVSPIQTGVYVPQNRRAKRAQSDIGEVTFKIGTMTQPEMKPPPSPQKSKNHKRKNKKNAKNDSQPNSPNEKKHNEQQKQIEVIKPNEKKHNEQQKPIEVIKPNEKKPTEQQKPIEVIKPNEKKPIEITKPKELSKSQQRKQEKMKFTYVPPSPNQEISEKEKEMMDKKKQQEKAEAERQKMDIKSLPAKKAYQPPKLTEEQLKNLQAPPTNKPTNKYVPKCGVYKPKTDFGGIRIGVAQQPQSLPKKSPFRGNRW